MKANKIVVWLDHTKAQFIKGLNEEDHSEIVHSEYESQERIDGMGTDKTSFGVHSSNNEHTKENRQKMHLDKYYKEIERRLESYDDILLRGPGIAKNELKNRMLANKHFEGKKVEAEDSAQLTGGEIKNFAREYFS